MMECRNQSLVHSWSEKREREREGGGERESEGEREGEREIHVMCAKVYKNTQNKIRSFCNYNVYTMHTCIHVMHK